LRKNDKNRVWVICNGSIPDLDSTCEGGSSQRCAWVLYASKWKRDSDWMVKTYKKEHRCLKNRTFKACDYKFLSKQIVQQVEGNPEVPIRALQNELKRKYQVDISKMKSFRAKIQAKKEVRGDYASHYCWKTGNFTLMAVETKTMSRFLSCILQGTSCYNI